MKYVLLALLFVSTPLWADAFAPLTKTKVQSALDLGEKINALEAQYPEVIQRLNEDDETDNVNQQALIKYLENSEAYPAIKALLSKSSFSDLNELYTVSERIFSSMAYVQLNNQAETEFSLDGIEKMIQTSIDTMKSSGAPAAIIAEMERDLAQHQHEMLAMKKYAEGSRPEDRDFVKTNLQWIIDAMPEE